MEGSIESQPDDAEREERDKFYARRLLRAIDVQVLVID
jgi:hypothetical protein